MEEVLLHAHQLAAQWVDAAQCALWRARLATQIRAETNCERTLLVLDRKGILRIEQYDALGAIAHAAEQAARVEDLSEIDDPV